MKILVTTVVPKEVTDDKATGANCRAAREWQHVTLRQASKKIGCSPAYLCYLENGRLPFGGRKGKGYIALCELWGRNKP